MSPLKVALVALALATALGCRTDRSPVHQAGDTVAAAPRDTAGRVATTSAADSGRAGAPRLGDAARAACDTLGEILRRVALATHNTAGAIGSPRDTTSSVMYSESHADEPACVLDWTDSIDRGINMDEIYGRLQYSGWQERPKLLGASGPDGDAMAYSRGAAACAVSGTWDGPRDDDSTYIPKPGFTIEVTCIDNRPDPF